MLKLATLGAALATIVSTQVNSSLLLAKDGANQWIKASTSDLVVTDVTSARTALTNAQTQTVLADISTTTLEVKEKVDPAAIMLGLAVVGGGAIAVTLSVRNANNPFKPSSNLYSSKFSPRSTENTIRIDQASRELQKKLLRLLHDDQNTANRLLSQVKINNPTRSINWCVEKVIYDLERDRGSY